MPAILVRTPYGKGADITPNYQAFVDHGYAVVVQDVRGRYESRRRLPAARRRKPTDGDDTLNWIARQPWSDGKIGMMGGSYLGIVQWKAALLEQSAPEGDLPGGLRLRRLSRPLLLHRRRHEAGQSPGVDGGESARARAIHPDFAKFVLHLPLRTADVAATGRTSPMYREAIAHPAFDAFWRAISTREHLDKIKVPVFSVGGWYDNFVRERPGGLRGAAQELGREPHPDRARGRTTCRYRFDGVDFGTDSTRADARAADRVVRPVAEGQGHAAAFQAARCEIFVMGANQWREEREWPPAQARADSCSTWRAAARPIR